MLFFRMGQAFNESYVDFGTKRKVNFCNKLFTAWDFNITNPKTAKLRQAHIRTEFHVSLFVLIFVTCLNFSLIVKALYIHVHDLLLNRRNCWIYMPEKRNVVGKNLF